MTNPHVIAGPGSPPEFHPLQRSSYQRGHVGGADKLRPGQAMNEHLARVTRVSDTRGLHQREQQEFTDLYVIFKYYFEGTRDLRTAIFVKVPVAPTKKLQDEQTPGLWISNKEYLARTEAYKKLVPQDGLGQQEDELISFKHLLAVDGRPLLPFDGSISEDGHNATPSWVAKAESTNRILAESYRQWYDSRNPKQAHEKEKNHRGEIWSASPVDPYFCRPGSELIFKYIERTSETGRFEDFDRLAWIPQQHEFEKMKIARRNIWESGPPGSMEYQTDLPASRAIVEEALRQLTHRLFFEMRLSPLENHILGPAGPKVTLKDALNSNGLARQKQVNRDRQNQVNRDEDAKWMLKGPLYTLVRDRWTMGQQAETCIAVARKAPKDPPTFFTDELRGTDRFQAITPPNYPTFICEVYDADAIAWEEHSAHHSGNDASKLPEVFVQWLKNRALLALSEHKDVMKQHAAYEPVLSAFLLWSNMLSPDMQPLRHDRIITRNARPVGMRRVNANTSPLDIIKTWNARRADHMSRALNIWCQYWTNALGDSSVSPDAIDVWSEGAVVTSDDEDEEKLQAWAVRRFQENMSGHYRETPTREEKTNIQEHFMLHWLLIAGLSPLSSRRLKRETKTSHELESHNRRWVQGLSKDEKQEMKAKWEERKTAFRVALLQPIKPYPVQ